MLVTLFTTACQMCLPQIQKNPVHAFKSHSLRINFTLILSSTPTSTKQSLSRRFPHQNPASIFILHHTCHLIVQHLMAAYCSMSTRNHEASQYVIFSSLLPLPPLPNIFFNTLFSNTLSLCSSIHARDNVSVPCIKTDKIIVLYTEMLTFQPDKLDRMVAGIPRI